MPSITRFRATFIAVEAVVAVVMFALGADELRFDPVPLRASNAVGDATCLGCHTEKAAYEHTAHRLTSRLPSRRAIHGDFSGDAAIVRTGNPALSFHMDSIGRGYFERAVLRTFRDTAVISHRIDFVTGSGRRGQSFLYWRDGDRLFQLPISYWRSVGWANSPAYPDGRPNFDRPIPPRCLECHAARFRPIEDRRVDNRYSRRSFILGIRCESCHTSGQEHVARERSLLRGILPPAIVNPAKLSRDRQMDACALCHAGAVPLESRPFSYVPGQRLYQIPELESRATVNAVDVHGNQVGMLERSRCFRESNMTCITCHDVHRTQRDVRELSGTCLTCHTVQSCGEFPRHGEALAGKCVDCHMPALPSASVVSNTPEGAVRQYARSHWIKVYPQFR